MSRASARFDELCKTAKDCSGDECIGRLVRVTKGAALNPEEAKAHAKGYQFAGDSPLRAQGATEGIVDDKGRNIAIIDGVSAPEFVGVSNGYFVVDYTSSDRLAVQNGVASGIAEYQIGGVSYTTAELTGQPALSGSHGSDIQGTDTPVGGREKGCSTRDTRRCEWQAHAANDEFR